MTYQVTDSKTGQIMGTYQTRKAATRKADKLDSQYGAIRFTVRSIDEPMDSILNSFASGLLSNSDADYRDRD